MKKISLLTGIFMLILGQAYAQSAAFTADSPRCANDTMHFTPGSPGGTILQEVWEFGDGTMATYLPPASFPVYATHLYATYGMYMVQRTVTFSSGPVSFSMQVLVNPRPVAFFMFQSTCVGQPVQFTDLSYLGGGFPGYIIQWVWDFGDGTPPVVVVFPSNPNVVHTFAGTATAHNVTLTVTSSAGCSSSTTNIVNSPPYPVANFTFSAIACAGQPVSFIDLSQTNGGGAIVSWYWNFSDPLSGATNTSSLQNPVHSFSGAGLYNVLLIVTNTTGCSDTIVITVVINPKPTADFIATTACMGQVTQFTSTSVPNAGSIVSYNWSFGDGSAVVTNSSPAHIYLTYGVYMATLTVMNSYGCSNSVTKPVTVNPNPIANFTFPGSVCNFQPVQFTDLSLSNGGPIVAWSWDFGDPSSGVNNTSTASNPIHVFSAPGSYVVNQTVTTLNQCQNSIAKIITIGEPPLLTNSPLSKTINSGQSVNIPLTFSQPNAFATWTSTVGAGTATITSNPPGQSGTLINDIIVNTGTANAVITYIIVPQTIQCAGPATMYVVTVLPGLLPTITGPTSVCTNDVATYITQPGMTGYLWTIPPGASILAGLGTDQVKIEWNTSGPKILSVSYIPPSTGTQTVPGTLGVTVSNLPGPLNNLANVVVPSGQSICSDASQTITLAGNGTSYVVQPGGAVELIAGQNILFLPGVNAQQGCHLHGKITLSCDYCPAKKQAITTALNPEIKPVTGNSVYGNVKIYPNPVLNSFILEINSNEPANKVMVDIYGMRGEKMVTERLSDERMHTFSASGWPAGVYFVHVTCGKWAEIVKIIKQ